MTCRDAFELYRDTGVPSIIYEEASRIVDEELDDDHDDDGNGVVEERS